MPVTDWPQSPAGLFCAELRPDLPEPDRAGHRLASSAGQAVCTGLRPDLSCAPVPVAHGGLERRPGWGVAGSSAPSCPPRPCRLRMASVAGRAEKTSSSAGRAGWGFLSLVPADRDRAAHRWPQAPAGLGCGVAGLRPSVPVVTLGVTDWPQSPAGLGFGVTGLRPCVPARAPAGHRWPQAPAGLWGFAVRSPVGSGGAAPGYLLTNCQVRGQSLQGGRARQFAAGAPRHDPALPSRRRLPAGGWGKDKAVTHRSLWRATAITVVTVERPCIGDGLIRPPAVGRVRDRGVGTGRGAPAANCTHGRLEATDPAPCSL
ncbi:hypothetical protein GA0115236_130615 [Streptomyces sp. IgraMP-1]|nr:hypothetical protein GA0115236_130615 [Streptomyces sp. IgraMP-1]